MPQPETTKLPRNHPQRTAAARAAKAAKQRAWNAAVTAAAAAPRNGSAGDLAGDLMTGAPEIAIFLGWDVHRVRHALAAGHLPATKIGQKYVANRSRLRRHFQGQGEEAAEA